MSLLITFAVMDETLLIHPLLQVRYGGLITYKGDTYKVDEWGLPNTLNVISEFSIFWLFLDKPEEKDR